MAPITSFLQLPREIRDTVYKNLLYSREGIILAYDFAAPVVDEHQIYLINNLPLAILRVNHQVHDEAFEILKTNQFTFDTSARPISGFLHSLPTKLGEKIKFIRRIGFTRKATEANSYNGKYYWQRLCYFMANNMYVKEVTLHIPRDKYQDSNKSDTLVDRTTYDWTIIDPLLNMVLEGHIERLTLLHPEIYDPNIDLEDFVAIKNLRQSRQLHNGRRFPFIVSQGRNGERPSGTALVLQRPLLENLRAL